MFESAVVVGMTGMGLWAPDLKGRILWLYTEAGEDVNTNQPTNQPTRGSVTYWPWCGSPSHYCCNLLLLVLVVLLLAHPMPVHSGAGQ